MPVIFVGNRRAILYVVAVMMGTEFCKHSCSGLVFAWTVCDGGSYKGAGLEIRSVFGSTSLPLTTLSGGGS